MNTSANSIAHSNHPAHTLFGKVSIANVSFSETMFDVHFDDGRIVQVPYYWFPRLFNASEQQRQHFVLLARRTVISWPDVHEDIHISGLLAGIPDQTRYGRQWRADNGHRAMMVVPVHGVYLFYVSIPSSRNHALWDSLSRILNFSMLATFLRLASKNCHKRKCAA